jgi:hypothetical protein
MQLPAHGITLAEVAACCRMTRSAVLLLLLPSLFTLLLAAG